ncbi:MAG: DUF3488 and transglutaminase-like domain-containing protein [Burkholderiales bacterium]|jgi:transglutaminase-like putative cysteine protease|nr:DUF3488 and transglutaminase-like domain-containing protein [Burkholderiales bacterium]
MSVKKILTKLQRRRRFDAMDSRLTNAHWFWLTLLVLITQLQLIYFIPWAVSLFGVGITLLRALSLYFVAQSYTYYEIGSKTTERSMDGATAKYGKRKPPFRWSVWLSVALGIAAVIIVRASYGYLFYRDSSVGLLFILVSIKFSESATRRDAMLLACLTSFLLITTFFYTQSPFTLITSLLAFFALGGTLKSIFLPMAPLEMGHIRSTMKKFAVLVLQGIPIALVLFVLFPRLSAPLWGVPHSSMAQTGLSDSMSPGEIAELVVSDDVAFRVEFDGAPPPNALRYWRGPVLSMFDGIVWRPGPTFLPQEEIPVSETKREISYTVTLEPHYRTWLFALELPSDMPQPQSGDFTRRNRRFAYKTNAQQLLSVVPVTQLLRYTQRSVLRDHYAAARNEADFNLRVPRNNNHQTYTLARELRAKSATPQEYVNTVLTYFRNESFYYSLSFDNLEMDPNNPVDGFLFGTRTGFCEHYSGAFVLLMRAGGVPARVVTGYQGGEINPQGDYMIVRQSDAHAWTEVLIEGQWRRVDPTAAVAPERIELGLGGALPDSDEIPGLIRGDMNWLKNLALRWDALKHAWTRNVIEFDYRKQRNLWSRWELGEKTWRIIGLAVGLAACWIVVLLLVWSWYAKRREPVQAAWENLCGKLARADLTRQPSEGAQTYLGRASQRWPQYRETFTHIDQVYTTLRYGRSDAKTQRMSLLALRRLVASFPSVRQLKSMSPRSSVRR